MLILTLYYNCIKAKSITLDEIKKDLNKRISAKVVETFRNVAYPIVEATVFDFCEEAKCGEVKCEETKCEETKCEEAKCEEAKYEETKDKKLKSILKKKDNLIEQNINENPHVSDQNNDNIDNNIDSNIIIQLNEKKIKFAENPSFFNHESTGIILITDFLGRKYVENIQETLFNDLNEILTRNIKKVNKKRFFKRCIGTNPNKFTEREASITNKLFMRDLKDRFIQFENSAKEHLESPKMIDFLNRCKKERRGLLAMSENEMKKRLSEIFLEINTTE